MPDPSQTPPPPATPPTSPARDADDRPGTRRAEAFSDGVFAIVITLLILELTSPHFERGHLAATLGNQWATYLAFLVSFVYVGVLWLNHHGLFRRIARLNLGLNWINLGLLLGAVIIPFPTAVIASAFADGNDQDQRVAIVLYAGAAALMSAAWLGAFAYLSRRPALLADGTTPDYMRRQRARPVTGIVLYVISGLAGWFISPVAGLVLFIIMIVYHALTSEGVRDGPLAHLIPRPSRD